MKIQFPSRGAQFLLVLSGTLSLIASADAKAATSSLPTAEDAALSLFAPPFEKWERENDAVRITDLSVVRPKESLSAQREKGKWKVIPYATAGFEGNALVTGPETEAPEVEVPLTVKGWHAVYVGLANVARGGSATDDGVWVRLSGQRGWFRPKNSLPLGELRRESIEDIYLTVADLTGKSIHLKQMPFRNGAVMCVRLVPLTSREVALCHGYLEKNTHRHMIATFDAHGMIWQDRPRTADDLRSPFEDFAESDFGKWWYQVSGADLTHYSTKVGTVVGSQTKDFARWEDREFAESVQHLIDNGINALQVARGIAREQHVEFHVFVRPSGWLSSAPWEENFQSRFAMAHPEWRCVDRDGTPTLYMSYAVPEVRRHILDVLRETLEFQPDGVGLLFHRGLPVLLWEQPFVDAFKKKYGRDPREIPEDDPTIGEMRAEILTTFLRELRGMLNETAGTQGRTTPYRISVATFSTEADNRRFGLDVERWVKEKLVDGDIAPAYFAEHTSFSPPDLAYYKRIVGGSTIGLYPMVRAYKPGKPLEFVRKQIAAYGEGADGICVWDPAESSTWGTKLAGQTGGQAFDVFRFLGHLELMKKWEAEGVPQPYTYPLTRFGDNHYSRWFPGTGL